MARRQTDIAAIEAELQRLQGLVNKDDDTTPEMVTRRVQSKACKKRPAQQYFPIEVVSHADRPAAPLELRSRVDAAQVQRDAARAGVYLVVAGGKAATLAEAEMRAAWKGQDKGEHSVRLVHQLFVVTPWLLKTPPRMAALGCLVMVGALMAGLIARQVRRALAALQPPLKGLMPAGRDSVRPTVTRLFKAFAASSLVQGKEACGRVVRAALLVCIRCKRPSWSCSGCRSLRSCVRSRGRSAYALGRRGCGIGMALGKGQAVV